LFGREDIAKHFQDDIDAIVAAANRDERGRSRLKALLQALFPQATGDRSENDWKRDLRICDQMSFDKYFQISTDPAKPSAHDVRRFIKISDNRAELVGLLRQTIANNTIEDFLDFILVTREEIPIDHMQAVATALFDIGDELPDPKPSLVSVGLDMQCNRIIYHRLKDEDKTKTTNLLWRAYSDTTGFILPIHNLALEDKAVRQRGEKTDFVILENRVNAFVDLVLGRIRERASDFSLLDHKECSYVLFRWKDWSQSNEVNDWLAQVITDPNRALRLLQHLVWVSIINGVTRVPFLNGETIEKLIDLSTLHEAIIAVPIQKRSQSDQANIALLEKAIARKSEGKPYSDVRANSFAF
jgi:predicted KAP-like P-loop ATPase